MLKNRQTATVQRHILRDTLGRQTHRLQNDLKSEVFDEKTVAMIENIRIVCDLKTVLSDVKKKGAIFFGLQNSAKFLSAVRSITGTIDDILVTIGYFWRSSTSILAKRPQDPLQGRIWLEHFWAQQRSCMRELNWQFTVWHCSRNIIRWERRWKPCVTVSESSDSNSPGRGRVTCSRGNDYCREWACSSTRRCNHWAGNECVLIGTLFENLIVSNATLVIPVKSLDVCWI